MNEKGSAVERSNCNLKARIICHITHMVKMVIYVVIVLLAVGE